MRMVTRVFRYARIIGCAATTVAVLLAQDSPKPPAGGRSVAVTLDDGPVVGEMKDLENFQRVATRLREALVAEKVPATIFINERQLNVPGQRDGRAEVLTQWLDAGFDLANHTYSHPSLNKVPLWQFQDDLIRGEVIMKSLLEARGRKLEWFRYPFLDSGPSAEVHQDFMNFLEQRHYRVAHVTVDYKDFTFAGAYLRQMRAAKPEVAEKIKQAYLDQIPLGFERAEKASLEVYGREIPQILLLHCNELNSVSLRESIARMRERGYRFITLDEATQDEAYHRVDSFAGTGGSWLDRTARSMGKKIEARNPVIPEWITELSARR